MATQAAPATALVVAASTDLAHLIDLADQARNFRAAARSPGTVKAYASDIAHFQSWAGRHDRPALPADPETVILYLVDLAATMKPATITRRVAAISVAHQECGLPSPTTDARVREVLRGIRRTLGVAAREAAPAGIGEIRRMVAHLPTSTLAGTRDRALLLVGFAAALRRSELIGLNVGDLDHREEGVVLRLRRSKTDQEGAGRLVALPYGRDSQTCPVRSLSAWLAAAAIEVGAVLRPVDRHGRIGTRGLTAQSVNMIVKRAAVAAGLEPDLYSGHSLRAGFATTAAANGASERAIANQTGHRSMEMLRRYVRHGSVFVDNAATMVGL